METSNQTEYNYNWDELSVGNYKQNDSGRFFGKNFSILCFNNEIKKKKGEFSSRYLQHWVYLIYLV